ncbi:MAG: DUF6273 domain-containing protein [Clostridiales bacterium]|nr:DUF6273 domain-containing protein [Clostridiales bacterium]
MRKALFLALILLMALSLAACGKTDVKAGDAIQLGGIGWLVLDVKDGRALVISEKIFENQAYHAPSGTITWENCSLREYLNGEFFDSTFSAEEKKKIVETVLKNDDNQWYGTQGGNGTADKVFLLSIEEVVQYFGDSGLLTDRPEGGPEAISDEYDSARIAVEKDSEEASWWWLRSPGHAECGAARVSDGGDIYLGGAGCVYNCYGVRPAMWIKL